MTQVHRFMGSLLLILLSASVAMAADVTTPPTEPPTSLEEQLKKLDAANQAPAAVTREKLYAVQERFLPLRNKSEFTLGGGLNLTGDSFIRSEQLEVGYRFHFNDRWAVALDYAWVANQLKTETENLKTQDGAIPDVPYALSRYDLMVELNAFYGKFRWSADTVSYFDQYWAIGPGVVQMNSNKVGAAVLDAGFAFWIGKWGSARLGLKDYYYNEAYRSGTQTTNNLHAHADIGYLF